MAVARMAAVAAEAAAVVAVSAPLVANVGPGACATSAARRSPLTR